MSARDHYHSSNTITVAISTHVRNDTACNGRNSTVPTDNNTIAAGILESLVREVAVAMGEVVAGATARPLALDGLGRGDFKLRAGGGGAVAQIGEIAGDVAAGGIDNGDEHLVAGFVVGCVVEAVGRAFGDDEAVDSDGAEEGEEDGFGERDEDRLFVKRALCS